MLKRISMLLFILFCLQTANADWVKQRSSSFAWLRDVYFLNANTGWIVGSDGTMLSTTDAGTTWSTVPKFTTDTLLQIHFTDTATGWMLCERNVFSRGRNAMSYLRKTTDGGHTWETIEFKDGGRERMTRLIFNKNGGGSAFGESGVFYSLQSDGRTWTRTPNAYKYLLLGGSYSPASNGAIVGSGGTVLFTTDSGASWEHASAIGVSDARFNSVFFASQYQAWAVGSNGIILATSGGGKLWRVQTSNVSDELTDVYFLNQREGWAVGGGGTIIHTTNGGSAWTTVNSHVKHRLERVVFNNGRGWAVGFGGTILSYDPSSAAGSKPVIKSSNRKPQ